MGKCAQLDRSQWMMSFTAPDGRTLQWVLRSQLGSGPLALLALRGFTPIRRGETHHPLTAIKLRTLALVQPANKAPGSAVIPEQTRTRVDRGPGLCSGELAHRI